MERTRIIVIGSVNVDYTSQVDHLPRTGETLLAQKTTTCLGGKGANQAIALHRLGSDLIFVGAVGTDEAAIFARSELVRHGLSDQHLLSKDGKTGMAFINVSKDGNNTIVVDLGANAKFVPEDILQMENLMLDMDYCLLQLELPFETIVEILNICQRHKVKVFLNPAPAVSLNLLENHLDKIELLIPNETELELLCGQKLTTDNMKDLCQDLLNKGVHSVLVTLGKHGSFYTNGDKEFFIEADKVEAVDPTAAGDL